jgi:hypothetical protein
MAKSKFVDDELIAYPLKDFRGGYNSYTGSKSNIDDNEIPVGKNAELDDNGSVTKVLGTSTYGAEIASGKAITGMGWLKNSSHNKVIVSAGTGWYYNNGTSTTALTGVTFTTSLKTYFFQALDRLYGVNATDTIAYTSDASTITTQSNGRAGISPIFFNQRIYLIDATTGRIWYSCAYTVTTDVTPDISVGFFGDFNTKLTGTVGVDFKDAGFVELMPKGGVEPTNLTVFGNTIKIQTKNHGVWEMTPTTKNTDNSVAHIVTQKVMKSTAPSPKGVAINGADIWFYTGQGLTSYGEVAQYQSPRPTAKSARIRSEMNSVADALKSEVALYTYNEKVYIAYGTGTYNDHLIKYDNRLNAFSTPIMGVNISCFLEYVDNNNVRRLLAGSSLSTDSYVYELESGTSYAGTAIDSYFEHKSIDAGRPGLIKYWAFADVFYTLLYGQISYTSYVDESTAISGVQVVGSSSTITVLGYPQPIGTFPVGYEFLSTASGTSSATNGRFRIDLEFTEGDKISTRFSNANLGEQYKIDKIIYYFQPAESIYQI